MIGAALVVLAAAALAAAAVAVFAGHRVFAFLGGYADRARPTAGIESRPGHEKLGGGAICVAAPIVFSAFYDPSVFVAEFLRAPEIWSAIVLLVIYVLTPLSGAVGLLMWKNAKLQWEGRQMIATNLLGKASHPATVIAAKMRPPLRDSGRVGFLFDNGWEFADTSWINIRGMYERARALGAEAEPWKEKATWKDVWGR